MDTKTFDVTLSQPDYPCKDYGTMPPLEFVTLDVFTQTRFAGNPLAVVKIP